MRELLTEEEIILLRTYAKYNIKIQPVADEMHYHRRTIFKKLTTIYKKTGFNPHSFWDLAEIIYMIDKEEANGREAELQTFQDTIDHARSSWRSGGS